MAIQLAAEAESKVRKNLIQKIKDKAAELGRVPRQSDFNCQQRFYAVFGSWNEALRAAGFPVVKENLRLKYRYLHGQDYEPTKEDCIKSLKRLSVRLGRCRPTAKDIESETGIVSGCPKLKVIKRLFGSLDSALLKAGLGDLPTRREKEKRALLESIPAGGFLLSSELKSKRERRYAKERNITVVRAPKDQNLLTVLDWMRGVERNGVLPSREEIQSAMGKKAFQYLLEYCSGLSLREIGRKRGLSGEAVRRSMQSGALKTVKKYLPKSTASPLDTDGLS